MLPEILHKDQNQDVLGSRKYIWICVCEIYVMNFLIFGQYAMFICYYQL